MSASRDGHASVVELLLREGKTDANQTDGNGDIAYTIVGSPIGDVAPLFCERIPPTWLSRGAAAGLFRRLWIMSLFITSVLSCSTCQWNPCGTALT